MAPGAQSCQILLENITVLSCQYSTMQLGIISIQGGPGLLVDGIRKIIDKYHKEEWANKTTLGYTGSDWQTLRGRAVNHNSL